VGLECLPALKIVPFDELIQVGLQYLITLLFLIKESLFTGSFSCGGMLQNRSSWVIAIKIRTLN
jgi:hypothetical protein